LRAGLAAPGLLVVALALVVPELRRPDGWPLPLAWTVVMAGVALLLAGVAWRTPWQRCAALFALALVGHAAALVMVDVPNYNVLQHYRTWQELLTSAAGLSLAVLFGQSLVGLVVLRRLVGALSQRTLLRPLLGPRGVLLAGILVFSAANLSREPVRYVGEVVLAVWVLAANGLNLALVAATVPSGALERGEAWLRRVLGLGAVAGSRATWDRALPWAVAVEVTLVCAALAWAVFERVPHIPDSVGYLFQANHFAQGRLYAPAPPDAAAFEFEKLHNDGSRWWNYGFPGWPAVLSLGVLLGVPWLVNPLLGGLTVLLAHALVGRLYGRGMAHAVILLLAVSPWFLFMSSGFEAHAVSLVWTLLALLALEQARAQRRALWGLAAGAGLGTLVLTRPLEAATVGPLVGLWALSVGRLPLVARTVGSMAVCSLVSVGLLFAYSGSLTGSPTYLPHTKWADERWYPGADRIGFGQDVGNLGWTHLDPFPGHGPLDVIVNANLNLYMVNVDLLGWSLGSLVLPLVALLWGRLRRPDVLFAGIVLATIAGHSVYWFSGGPDIGARYWYQVLLPLMVLAVRGIQTLLERWPAHGMAGLDPRMVGAFVVAASLVAVANYVPWRSLGKYYHYRAMGADVARLAEACQFGRSLVFVQEGEHYSYAAAFVYNSPMLDSSGPVYARDPGPTGRDAVASHFPGRPVWVVADSSTPGGGFRVISDPGHNPSAACTAGGPSAPIGR
jgi:hypothetical protein